MSAAHSKAIRVDPIISEEKAVFSGQALVPACEGEERRAECENHRGLVVLLLASPLSTRDNRSVQLTNDHVTAGTAALACGDWANARTYYEAALVGEESPQALEGLSMALYWLDDLRASLEHRTHAYALYREQGDLCRCRSSRALVGVGTHGLLRQRSCG